MTPVLNKTLPHSPWSDPLLRRLPGTQPADPSEAFASNETYGGQMALRDALIDSREAEVIACLPEADTAARELLGMALDHARTQGYEMGEGTVTRPDGVALTIRRAQPMRTLGRLFQADYCILQKPEGAAEHVLTAAALCFPAGWTLSEKIGRPLERVHRPVPSYDEGIGIRVQRLFDGLAVGRALWRANAHLHMSPDLFTPRREGDPRPSAPHTAPFIRSERQVLFRLPESGAVVFSILSYMIARDILSPEQRRTLAEANLAAG